VTFAFSHWLQIVLLTYIRTKFRQSNTSGRGKSFGVYHTPSPKVQWSQPWYKVCTRKRMQLGNRDGTTQPSLIACTFLNTVLIRIEKLHVSLHFNGHFPGGCGLSGTRMSPFWILLKQDDGGDGDNWACKMCKSPAKFSPSTNQHPVFFTDRMPFTVAQPTVSKHWREECCIPMNRSKFSRCQVFCTNDWEKLKRRWLLYRALIWCTVCNVVYVLNASRVFDMQSVIKRLVTTDCAVRQHSWSTM